MHAKVNKHMSEQLTRMVPNGPKTFPTSILEGVWMPLGATLEARCFQDFICDDVGFVLGPRLGQSWDLFGHHVFDVFGIAF